MSSSKSLEYVFPQIWPPKLCKLLWVTQRLKSEGFKEMLSYPFCTIPLSLCMTRSALSCHCFQFQVAYYYSHLWFHLRQFHHLLFHGKGDKARITELPKIIAENFLWIKGKISVNQSVNHIYQAPRSQILLTSPMNLLNSSWLPTLLDKLSL